MNNLSDKMEEYCGVLGVFSPLSRSLRQELYSGLNSLQHRGQDGSGIAWFSDKLSNIHSLGLLPELFKSTEAYLGTHAIGHVRYGTNDCRSFDALGPLIGSDFAIAHNGHLSWESSFEGLDTQRLVDLIEDNFADSMVDTLKSICPDLKGSYAFTILTKNSLIGVRDPLGIRPLVLGRLPDLSWVLSSESCSIESMGGTFIRMINPGEIIEISNKIISSSYIPVESKNQICAFEYIYFSRPDSYIDNCSVYKFRFNSGKCLAKNFKFDDADLVIGAPDSGIPAALGYAEESKIKYADGFVKNHYIGRTFIEPTDNLRKEQIKLKLNVLRENVNGKTIVLIDDSLVRGNTALYMISELRKKGAKKIYFLVASPAIVAPCFLGINTKSHEELIANNKSNFELASILNADYVGFLSPRDLYNLTNSTTLCMNCFKEEDYETIYNTNGCC